MNRVCTICARGGSKGVKGKNLIQISGKPLLAHSIEQAIKSGLFVAVAVSSDDPQILECAQEFGANQLYQNWRQPYKSAFIDTVLRRWSKD